MEVVILVGIQAAGKSTFYRARFAATHAHVSKDLLHNSGNPRRRQLVLIEEALRAGRSVVVDNTNPTPADREPLITLARAHGAAVAGYYFDAVVRECLARNRERIGSARVPDVAIYATAKRIVPPNLAEGFDLLYRVRINPTGGFTCEPWNGATVPAPYLPKAQDSPKEHADG